MKIEMNKKSSFIAIIGRPNVGKSSLLNNVLGQKLAIVTHKPQTTRTRILGVLTKGETQLVFIDTPGMHKPKNKLDNYMVKTINQSVMGVDIAVLVVEAGKEISQTELRFTEKLKKLGLSCVLVINKIDLIKDKTDIIRQIDNFSKIYEFKAIVPLSAKKTSDEGVICLIDELMRLSEPGEHLFEEDALTDQPERVIVAEIIREKMLKLLDKEVPHGIAVEIEKMKQRDNNEITDIDAVIYCEKDSHKGMIIGKQGLTLKRIGTYARQDIESFFETKINLKLWVKVKADWRNKDFDLRNFGFNKDELKI